VDQRRRLPGRQGADVDLALVATGGVRVLAQPVGHDAELAREGLDALRQVGALPGLGGLVPDHASRLAAEAARAHRPLVVDLDDAVLVALVPVGLCAGDEAGPQPHADRADRQGRGQPAAVGDPAGREHGHVDRVDHGGQQRQGPHASRVTAPVVALGDHGVDAATRDAYRVARVPDQRDDLHAELVALGHDRSRIPEPARQHRHALLEDDVDLGLHLAGEAHRGRVTRRPADGREQDVDPERTIGPVAHLVDLLPELLGAERGPSDHSQRARFGHGGRELAARDVAHARLQDRVLDPEHVADRRSQCGMRHEISPGSAVIT
jgi:hypothetical protein